AYPPGMPLPSTELAGLPLRPLPHPNGAARALRSTLVPCTALFRSQTVTLNVTPVNDAPVADADKTVTVVEDSGNTALDIAAPTDIDGDPLTITVPGVPNGGIGTIYLANGVTALTPGMTLTSTHLTA